MNIRDKKGRDECWKFIHETVYNFIYGYQFWESTWRRAECKFWAKQVGSIALKRIRRSPYRGVDSRPVSLWVSGTADRRRSTTLVQYY